MATGDRGASVNRTAPRKAKRVAKPVDLSGVKGSGKAQTGVRSAPVVKAAAVRSVSRMKGSGAAGFAVKQDSRPVKKQSVVDKAVGIAGDTVARAIPGGNVPVVGTGIRAIAKATPKQVVELGKAAKTGVEASNRAKGAGGVGRGPLGAPVIATSTPAQTVAAQKGARKAIKNAPKDAADIAVSIPPSMYYLGKTAVTEPEKVPEMGFAQYKEFFKDPGKFASEKPVSTLGLFVPPAKAGSLGVGAGLRAAGKQTTEGGVRTVKGFAVEKPITKPRGAVGNAVATARAKKGPTKAPDSQPKKHAIRKPDEGFFAHKGRKARRVSPSRAISNTIAVGKSKYSPQTPLTAVEQAGLVDDFMGYSQRTKAHVTDVAAKAAREVVPPPKRGVSKAKRAARKDAKEARGNAVKEATEKALEDVQRQLDKEFVQKFGATGRPELSAVKRDELKAARADAEVKAAGAKAAAKDSRTQLDLELLRAQNAPRTTSPKLQRNVDRQVRSSQTVRKATRRVETARIALTREKATVKARGRNATEAQKQRLKDAHTELVTARAWQKAARQAETRFARKVSRERVQLARAVDNRRGGRKAQRRSPEDRLFDAMQAEHTAARAVSAAQRAAEAAKREHIDFVRARAQSAVMDTKDRVGQLFDHATDADHVAKRASVPTSVVRVKDADGITRFGVVPKTMADQRLQHGYVGTSPATGAVLLRKLRKAFTQTVLPYRPAKWLTGQAVEPTVRAAASGVRPGDKGRMRYFIEKLNEQQPGLGDKFRRETLTGGQGGFLRDLDDVDRRTLAETAEANPRIHAGSGTDKLMRGASRVAESKPGRGVSKAHNAYVDTIFRKINSDMLEVPFQDRFGGAALRQIPELEGKAFRTGGRMSRKTLDDLAERLAKDPKALDRASQRIKKRVEYDYGKYADFSPGQRERNLHWTPFAPWAVNAAKWTPTVPFKRPVVGMTVSTAHNASEDWRAKHGLSSYKGKARPWWQRSSIPFKDDTTINVGKYGPWGITADPVNTAGGQMLPFVAPAWASLMYGVDWKGNKIYGPDGEPLSPAQRAAFAATQVAKANLGPLGTLDDLANLSDPAITGRPKKGTVLENLESQVNILKSLEKSAAQAESRKDNKKRKAKRKGGAKSAQDLVDEYRKSRAQDASTDYSKLVEQYRNGEW